MNQLDANDNVPVPVPKPMVVLAANGSIAKVPVPITWLVEANDKVLARNVMRPLCVVASPTVLAANDPLRSMPSLLPFKPAVPIRVRAPVAVFKTEPLPTNTPSLLVPEPLLPPPVPVMVRVALPVPVIVEPNISTPWLSLPVLPDPPPMPVIDIVPLPVMAAPSKPTPQLPKLAPVLAAPVPVKVILRPFNEAPVKNRKPIL